MTDIALYCCDAQVDQFSSAEEAIDPFLDKESASQISYSVGKYRVILTRDDSSANGLHAEIWGGKSAFNPLLDLI